MKQDKTAILIFANNAEKELITKSIQSADFFDLLNTETLKTVKKTSLPYYHFSEKEQTGQTFGERFSNAIQAIYDEGYETVISIGNDTPHLKASHILKAVQQLESSDYVLGPSTDGGFYLMGFKKAYFNKQNFEALPWQTSKLQFVLRKALKRNLNKVSYLEVLSDIDDDSDIELVLNHFKTLGFNLKRLLLLIRKIDPSIFFAIRFFTTKIYSKLKHNKGSPALLHS